MSLAPSETTAETIPGNPSHLDFAAAENELALLASRGAGQPYLLAIKLRDEPNKLHLRAYLENPSNDLAWADAGLVPEDIQSLFAKTSRDSALAWSTFQSGGVPIGPTIEDVLARLGENRDFASVLATLDRDTAGALADYLQQTGYGLFFDPARNHDAWVETAPVSEHIAALVPEILAALRRSFPRNPQDDASAEMSEDDPDEVDAFRNQIEQGSFEVPDSTATLRTRGSAQRAFADAVKTNYRMRCAITGIATRDFLVAAHIVPWSEDHSIRLDPTNGICLSLIVDRAFENGHILIEDDYTIIIDWDRVGDDEALRSQLEPYDGRRLNTPAEGRPKVEYLQRRRALIAPTHRP